ncbi:hypothetical protein FVEG_00766 [Fusarium verticillioides 7600]|uniref:Uncharacterized protein n=1 Tax=Gibberella moniliformis (strain M3125 / FGSC 7600) TaxID=334819 RepID=W7LN72_GIBM7|nr:hypothetical protein FVEG_00766 [Fusarium verticillioides 7600]EWG36920.1 hypothetical protein FVEG_00766 [Fusarium verticillioides 7600]
MQPWNVLHQLHSRMFRLAISIPSSGRASICISA